MGHKYYADQHLRLNANLPRKRCLLWVRKKINQPLKESKDHQSALRIWHLFVLSQLSESTWICYLSNRGDFGFCV